MHKVCIKMVLFFIGVWLNGRVAVSKTVGCGFESYHPCQNNQINLFFARGGRMCAYAHSKKASGFFARTGITRVNRVQALTLVNLIARAIAPSHNHPCQVNKKRKTFCFLFFVNNEIEPYGSVKLLRNDIVNAKIFLLSQK